MKNFTFLSIALLAISLVGSSSAVTHSAFPNAAIIDPDDCKSGPGKLMNSEIDVSESITITHISVKTNLPHSYSGDMGIRLMSPSGKIRQLIFSSSNIVGQDYHLSSSDDQKADLFAGTEWRDDGESVKTFDHVNGKASSPLKPAQSLSDFYGQNSKGKWTLTFADYCNEDTGKLVSWSITIEGEPECSVVTRTRTETETETIVKTKTNTKTKTETKTETETEMMTTTVEVCQATPTPTEIINNEPATYVVRSKTADQKVANSRGVFRIKFINGLFVTVPRILNKGKFLIDSVQQNEIASTDIGIALECIELSTVVTDGWLWEWIQVEYNSVKYIFKNTNNQYFGSSDESLFTLRVCDPTIA